MSKEFMSDLLKRVDKHLNEGTKWGSESEQEAEARVRDIANGFREPRSAADIETAIKKYSPKLYFYVVKVPWGYHIYLHDSEDAELIYDALIKAKIIEDDIEVYFAKEY